MRALATRESNLGWDASQGGDVTDMDAFYGVNYAPIDPDFFPAPRNDQNGDGIDENDVPGAYAWTRAGLQGIDYGGKEINTERWPVD